MTPSRVLYIRRLYKPISMLPVVRDVLVTGVEPYRIPPPLPWHVRPLYTPISMLSVVRDVLVTGVGPYRIPSPLPRRVSPFYMSRRLAIGLADFNGACEVL